MKWTEHNNNIIFLPISNGNPHKSIHECSIDPNYSVSMSNKLKQCWNSPNLSNSETLCKELLILLAACSELILKAQKTIKNYQKTSKLDLVTEADIGIEKLIRFWFSKFLPKHKIIGEEMKKEKILTTDYVWYLDPIDGTSNYTKQSPDFCINLGSTYQASPYINIIYSPINKTYHYQTPNSTSYDFFIKNKSTICSEFYPTRRLETKIFNSIIARSKFTPYNTKALGVSLLRMIEGNVTAFYKLNFKPWDIIAGAGILSTNNNWDITLVIDKNKQISLFSNEENFVTHLNNCYQGNCRIGSLIITLKNQKNIKEIILNEILNQ